MLNIVNTALIPGESRDIVAINQLCIDCKAQIERADKLSQAFVKATKTLKKQFQALELDWKRERSEIKWLNEVKTSICHQEGHKLDVGIAIDSERMNLIDYYQPTYQQDLKKRYAETEKRIDASPDLQAGNKAAAKGLIARHSAAMEKASLPVAWNTATLPQLPAKCTGQPEQLQENAKSTELKALACFLQNEIQAQQQEDKALSLRLIQLQDDAASLAIVHIQNTLTLTQTLKNLNSEIARIEKQSSALSKKVIKYVATHEQVFERHATKKYLLNKDGDALLQGGISQLSADQKLTAEQILIELMDKNMEAYNNVIGKLRFSHR